jgi:hypothetical protein
VRFPSGRGRGRNLPLSLPRRFGYHLRWYDTSPDAYVYQVPNTHNLAIASTGSRTHPGWDRTTADRAPLRILGCAVVCRPQFSGCRNPFSRRITVPGLRTPGFSGHRCPFLGLIVGFFGAACVLCIL